MMIPRSILFCFALIFGNVTSFVRGFSTLKRFCALPRQQHSYEHHRQSFPRLRELAVDFVENSDFDDEIIGDESGSVIDDLNWRVEKLRLEEENTKRFLKSGPRFLPYEECRNWVQAWGHRWKSKEDWRNWIAQGEKRNAYIPSRPDEYYSKLGDWISWDDFLGV